MTTTTLNGQKIDLEIGGIIFSPVIVVIFIFIVFSVTILDQQRMSDLLPIMLADIKHYPLYIQASYVAGVVVISYWLLTLTIGIYARLLRPGKNLKKEFGLWGEC